MRKLDYEFIFTCGLVAFIAALGMVAGIVVLAGAKIYVYNLPLIVGSFLAIGGLLWGLLLVLKQGYRNPTGFRRWVKVAGSGGLCYTRVMGTWKSKTDTNICYSIIFGKDIRIIYENISGKNILFGRTDILSAVQEMYQKRC